MWAAEDLRKSSWVNESEASRGAAQELLLGCRSPTIHPRALKFQEPTTWGAWNPVGTRDPEGRKLTAPSGRNTKPLVTSGDCPSHTAPRKPR